jgi:carboxylesterase
VINPALDPGRFAFDGGQTGILLLHGYTGATPEVRPLGEFLAQKGMTVVAPLLPGHGTSPEDLNERSWREVAEAAASELYDLLGKCDSVFVGGLSMGGLLTLHLGDRCDDIAGLIPMAPALFLRDPLSRLLPIIKHLIASLPKKKDINLSVEDPSCIDLLWSYDRNPLRFAAEVQKLMHHVRDRLGEIQQPLLAFQGVHDRTVPTRSAHHLMREVGSSDAELVMLRHSGHCLSVDQERDQVFAKIWQWIQQRNPA